MECKHQSYSSVYIKKALVNLILHLDFKETEVTKAIGLHGYQPTEVNFDKVIPVVVLCKMCTQFSHMFAVPCGRDSCIHRQIVAHCYVTSVIAYLLTFNWCPHWDIAYHMNTVSLIGHFSIACEQLSTKHFLDKL